MCVPIIALTAGTNGNGQGAAGASAGKGAGGTHANPPGGTIFTDPTPGAEMPRACFQHDKTLATMLGEVLPKAGKQVVWLMSQSAGHKRFFIDDLEWMVMTPLLLQQYRVYYAKDRPIGVLFWGFVMPEACFQHDADVEARLLAGNAKLKPQDWKSGDKLWVIDVIAPFGGTDEMVKDLKLKVFAERELKVLTTHDGKLAAKVVG